jgi:hypothetical protein
MGDQQTLPTLRPQLPTIKQANPNLLFKFALLAVRTVHERVASPTHTHLPLPQLRNHLHFSSRNPNFSKFHVCLAGASAEHPSKPSPPPTPHALKNHLHSSSRIPNSFSNFHFRRLGL